MNLSELLSVVVDSFSGVRAKDVATRIASFHRIQASPGYDAALDFIVEELDEIGIDSSTSTFAADGRTETFGWVSPPGWLVRSGELTQVEPASRSLASYDEVRLSILGQSGAGDAEGEVIHVGLGDSEACFEGRDLEGAFLLTCGRPASMLRFLQGRRVAGIIVYPDVERASTSYDLIRYAGLFPRADELRDLPMGFSISRQHAESLLGDLEKGPVRVRGRVDAIFDTRPMRILQGTIKGAEPEAHEVLLTAHLCHPAQSANDNASGSAVLVEVARVLAGLAHRGVLANTVRLLWVPEFNGTLPWVAANEGSLRNVLFSLNLDMVGESPESIGEPLRVFRVPASHPVFLNACFEPLLDAIAQDSRCFAPQGTRRPLHWSLDAPSGGSDHLALQAPPAGVPSAMLGHDDPFWHTDQDTIDKVDPTRLKHVGVLSSVLATLPSWGREEAQTLAEWLMVYSQRALADASRLARSDEAGGSCISNMAFHLETARASSLSAFLGADAWDEAGYVEALRATRRALHGSLANDTRDARPSESRDLPIRTQDGPVRSEAVQDLPKPDREFLDALSSHHGAVLQVLANLADGTRTIPEMAACLSLDFGRSFSEDDVSRAVSLLGEMGYVDVRS